MTDAVDKITALEKQTRNVSPSEYTCFDYLICMSHGAYRENKSADMTSTATLLVLVTRLCYEANSYDLLMQQLTTMSKKHGQLKEAVVRMVDEAMTWLPVLHGRKDKGEFKGGKDWWLELLTTLRDITEGKVCLVTFLKL